MNAKSLLLLVGCLLGLLPQIKGDGFIVIEGPVSVPPGHFPFAPLEVTSHHVNVQIDGQVAVTSIDQEFYNPNDQRLEGTYMFPVPKDAHIDKLSMEIGGKMVEAELLSADKARQIYEDIVRKMRDPALLEYAGRDLFKVRIYPIEPRSRKPIKITYSELLRSDNGSVTYTYPMSTEKFSAQPIKSLSMKVDLKSAQPLASIYSPSHKVEIKRDVANRAVVGYESTNEKPETDFQLVYSTAAHDIGLSLLTHKTEGEDGYFLLLAAPTVAKEAKPSPKDVVFVVDTSGSMAGAKLQQAKKALQFCVENLNAEDRFEIVRFSTEAEPLFGKLMAADTSDRKRATDFIDALKPIGGTAIADALTTALKMHSGAGDRPFVVIFLTDGLPTVGTRNPTEIVSEVKKTNAARIFSFGIGSDVNTQLLDQIAENTRAFSQYVLADEDLEVKVSNFYTRIKEPALTNLRLAFNGGVRTSKMYPAALPDLFKGDQLVVAGSYSGSGEVEAKLTGTASGREQIFTYKVHFEDRAPSNEFVPRLWATRRVGFLLDEIRLHGETRELRDEATDLARKYGIVTPYTAYLIVEDEARRDVPTASRSLRQMSADAPVLDGVAKAWSGFKDKKEGADAVANARSQNLFKYAEQAGASISAGAAESSRGLGLTGAPAAPPEAKRITQYTQQSKFVSGRNFFQNGKQWVDSNAQNTSKRERVQFNSDAYFALLRKHPEAAPWMALGQNILLVLDNTTYEITD
ncbi:MAG: VIT and VWA domain-containing protein [Verrucomicrobiota bacterium]|nr:VIT and VWA domain-containing protein [Verrucomicrobiota bacterium]